MVNMLINIFNLIGEFRIHKESQNLLGGSSELSLIGTPTTLTSELPKPIAGNIIWLCSLSTWRRKWALTGPKSLRRVLIFMKN
jgi:hypothetical protein